MKYQTRRAKPEDVRPALDLALSVFMEFEAPDYEPAAAVNFKKDCIENKAYTDRLCSGDNMMFVALDGDKNHRNDGRTQRRHDPAAFR